MITNAQKIGRNEQCPCGSKKKWKYCCGNVVKPLKKKLTQQGFQQCFMVLVEKFCDGKVDIACEDLDSLVKDNIATGLGIIYKPETDSFHFEIVKGKISPIIQADKKVRVPLIEGN